MSRYLELFGQLTRSLENEPGVGDYDEERVKVEIVHARQDIGASGMQLVYLNETLSSIRLMLIAIIIILGTLTAKVLGWF